MMVKLIIISTLCFLLISKAGPFEHYFENINYTDLYFLCESVFIVLFNQEDNRDILLLAPATLVKMPDNILVLPSSQAMEHSSSANASYHIQSFLSQIDKNDNKTESRKNLHVIKQRTNEQIDQKNQKLSNVHPSSDHKPKYRGTQCPPIILLLGDSVDRHAVLEYCRALKITPKNWSHGLFRHKDDPLCGAAVCHSPRGTIGHLHLFGSNATGPYGTNQDITSHAGDPFIDTKPRIAKGIELFTQEIGRPTLIVYQTLLWDLFWTIKSPTLSRLPRKKQREVFGELVIERLQEVIRIKEESTALYLRTAPPSWWQYHTVLEFNHVTRRISRDMNLTLVDFDTMVWGSNRSFARRPHLFRDLVHPRKEWTQMLASHLINIGNNLCASAGQGRGRSGAGGARILTMSDVD